MKKYELLLIDDEPANLQKLHRTFVDHYKVHLAQTGEEALQILKAHPIDAVITDQKMPNMTGIEFLDAASKEHPDLVRIILTGYAEIDDLIAAINTSKVDKYITKPWAPDDLRMAVREALEKRELQRENERLAAELQAANERLRTENIILRQEAELEERSQNIVYGGPEMENILKLLRRVTGTETTVLIQGETGTGKELIARFIHNESNRRDRIFIPSTAAPSPANSSKASSSAMPGAPSPAPARKRRAISRWRTAARSSSTKSARRPPNCRSSCCG